MDRIQKYIILYKIIGFFIPCGRYGWLERGKILIRSSHMICRPARSLLRWVFFGYIVILLEYWANFDKTTFCLKTCTPSSGFQKRYGQNDRRKRGNISCFWSKSRFTIANTLQTCIFEWGSAYLSIHCLINSFSHEQLLW